MLGGYKKIRIDSCNLGIQNCSLQKKNPIFVYAMVFKMFQKKLKTAQKTIDYLLVFSRKL
jgi:hypothetical protein